MTFSIVARDPETGAFGVATATAGPMVGALVPHTRAGFGAAATQAMTNPYLAIDALALIDGTDAHGALAAALSRDQEAALRQAIVIDRAGRTAGWTGPSCVPFAGHLTEEGVAVAGNMLVGEEVLAQMLAAYRSHRGKSDFASCLLHALKAGAAAGGDKRGIGSAALRVHGEEAYAAIDIRVDWSEAPLAELEALLHRAIAGSYAEFFATLPRRAK